MIVKKGGMVGVGRGSGPLSCVVDRISVGRGSVMKVEKLEVVQREEEELPGQQAGMEEEQEAKVEGRGGLPWGDSV
jgi:hypothetical protein